jgi:hypothetical protein
MEQPNLSGPEQGDDIAKVERFLESTTMRYRAEGVPLGNDSRIDMAAYKGLYPDVAKDLERNRDWGKEWFGGLSPEMARERRRLTEGEQLEMLAYAILAKNLGERFVVARTSPHDDRVNKVDTIILDKETGNLVCAFDEVGDASGVNYEKKQTLVRDRNLKGGASLKYGIGVRREKGKQEVVPSAAEHLPLFYLAVPGDRVKKGMKEFVADPVQQSEFEERLFSYFIATISAQIGALELYHRRLDPELKKKLEDFKGAVAAFNARQGKRK